MRMPGSYLGCASLLNDMTKALPKSDRSRSGNDYGIVENVNLAR
jgi:hypothetical protein